MERKLIPPSADSGFVEHVANTGLALRPDKIARFWRGRRSFVRDRLLAVGWPEEDIDAELERFRDAVKAETGRLRVLAGEREGEGEG